MTRLAETARPTERPRSSAALPLLQCCQCGSVASCQCCQFPIGHWNWLLATRTTFSAFGLFPELDLEELLGGVGGSVDGHLDLDGAALPRDPRSLQPETQDLGQRPERRGAPAFKDEL